MAAVRDVTQRRQQQDELERVNRNLESFAYSIAHDLRTPLRALAGVSAALLEDRGDALGEAGRGYAARIEAASEQMGALIDDLLHLSGVSRAVINLQPVDLGAEVASIAEELQRRAARSAGSASPSSSQSGPWWIASSSARCCGTC